MGPAPGATRSRLTPGPWLIASGAVTLLVLARPEHPANTLAELVDYAKENPRGVRMAGSAGSRRRRGW